MMAKKPLRPCNKTGCRSLTENRYCKEHEYLHAENHRKYNRFIRDKKTDSFYKSKSWVLTRQQVLIRDNGLCQHCLTNKKITLAEMVDHVVPIKVRWDLRLTLSNLQSLCNACHNTKTSEDKRKYPGI